MNIFDLIQDVLRDKKGDVFEDIEQEKEFSPYLLQRWLSMYSPSFAILLNETVNCYWKAFETKQEWYKYFIAIVPKSSFKRIQYIKKEKKEAKKKGVDEEYIQYLSERLELSQREIKDYIETKCFTNKELKKILGE